MAREAKMALSDRESERLARIETALLKLSDLDWQIFLALHFDDMSVREIARHACLSQRRVKRRLCRVIRIVARELEDGP
ncbi:sigma factor-like helix-turn-helix DNA-binding protein [Novosphingobium sp. AP12]|uniref:sigma factor-like helix-turn-helix DNA-binding protein n=1 Tax=Novosphingobium sp. AP12 TaxID=1144305 RepID=UPI0012F90C25|nr:sigma factor-like helix-turn-helix DNA-binding protein [Novosphingobium sp. AP12]